MLSIQDIGLSIFSDTPKKFYILGGAEYGIKDKYLEILSDKIGPKAEYDSVFDVINLMSNFHIIPLQPKVYVVRYDKSFLSALSKDWVDRIQSLNIIGTLVLLYEDIKDLNKVDKYFPENTASIDRIDPKHMAKYLKSDFSALDSRSIEFVTKHASNYYQAKNVCRCLLSIQDKIMLSEAQIISLFDLKESTENQDVQIAIASRNFKALMYAVDRYSGDRQTILYQFLYTMIELDKCNKAKYSDSPLKKYAKNWQPAEVYYMFNNTYNIIKQLRSGYVADVDDLLVWLGTLLMFKPIPDMR